MPKEIQTSNRTRMWKRSIWKNGMGKYQDFELCHLTFFLRKNYAQVKD